MSGLAITLGAPRNVDIEQVNLVVARGALAVRVVHEAGGGNAPVPAGTQRQRATDDPQAQSPGRFRQEILDRSGAVAFRDAAFVRILETHEGEVLRKHGERGCKPRRLFEIRAGLLQVGHHVRSGRHLYCGDFHDVNGNLNLPRPLRGRPTSPADAAPHASDLPERR